MLGLTHKPKHMAPKDTRFVVYRSRGCDKSPLPGTYQEAVTKAQAWRAFTACVAAGTCTPFNGRRLLITGPDYTVQDEDHDDPLLIGATAVRAVLTDEEFHDFCAQTARYALEAE